MPPVSINLGSIKVAGKTPNLVVTLSSTLVLALPASFGEETTAVDLRQASAEGRIWISKAGGCRVDVESLVNGEGLMDGGGGLDQSVVAVVGGFLEGCSVWKQIGLELRTNHAAYAQDGWSNAQASYFLHHPDLSSEMIAPAEVPCAQVQGLSCQVNYDFRPRKMKAGGKKQALKQEVVEPTHVAPETNEEPPSHTHGLRPRPKRSRKAKAVQDDRATATPDPSASTPQPETGLGSLDWRDTESLVTEAITEMASLLDFAFRKLIGFKGTCPGMRTVRGTRSPSLIEIAPAVWDLQYLHMMCVHAQVIPSIAAGVVRLRNAQSASLRAKLDILTGRETSHDMSERPDGSEADDVKRVKGGLWSLCQTRIRPEPIKGHQIKRNADQSTTRQPPTELAPGGKEMETPPDCADGSNGDVFDTAENYDLWADYDHDSALLEGFQLEPLEIGLLPTPPPYMYGGDEEPLSDGLMPSSEGDYFYTDGQGNIYGVERHDVPQDHQLEWPSSPQHAASEGFTEEEDIEVEDWDPSPNETYIMYHEVQHWPPEPGLHIHAVDAGHFLPPPPPHPDDDPFNGWVGD